MAEQRVNKIEALSCPALPADPSSEQAEAWEQGVLGTAVQNWPKEYSIPYDDVLHSRSSGKRGGRGMMFTVMAFVLLSSC